MHIDLNGLIQCSAMDCPPADNFSKIGRASDPKKLGLSFTEVTLLKATKRETHEFASYLAKHLRTQKLVVGECFANLSNYTLKLNYFIHYVTQ